MVPRVLAMPEDANEKGPCIDLMRLASPIRGPRELEPAAAFHLVDHLMFIHVDAQAFYERW